MKICYLANAESYHTKKWCNYFADKGYEIVVVSLSPGEIEGVRVYNFDEENLRTRSALSKLSYLGKVRKVKKILKHEKPDILHAHYASSYGLLGSLLNYYPYVLSVWGSDIYIFPKKSFIHRYIIKHNLKSADYILSTSQNMAKETSLYTKKNITITPFGIDTSIFRPVNVKTDNKKFIIGIVKTLSRIYGIDYLIRAFKIIKDRYEDVELHIAGKGEQEDELKSLCSRLDLGNSVRFLGYLNNEYKVAETFNTFDIAVFPSLSESFGVAALEAQACGIPVIVTNVGGFPEVVQKGNTGLIIEKENVEEIASSIERLMNDENRRDSMSKVGRQFVVDNYDIRNHFKNVDSFYREIVV